ncbi:hypothetical protein N7535_002848 [Penicillium sp. DV-2018c]|nr:hypothetical protein N7461_001467 [Penicillium sp. DV-2018c]KAJ5575922.1 hypothetical protein N7535_002848 [Penicillium sp. DV-2018c]
MEPKLPHGLVAMSKLARGHELQQETLSTGDYKNLWQAYSTSYLVSKDQTERRLEHLFWRIWGTKQLLHRLNTHTLDGLILRIKAPATLIEVVAVDVALSQSMSTTDDKQEKVNPTSFPILHLPSLINHSHKPINQTQPVHTTGVCSLAPISNHPQAASSNSNKTTRLLLDTSIGTKITLDPTNSPTPTMTSPTDQIPIPNTTDELSPKTPSPMASPTSIPDGTTRQNPNPNPKKTHLTTTRNGRNPRRRPVFNRRKSSQTSVSKALPPSRRRSEPTTKTEKSNTRYEDSYVELGLLQHLSFRDEDDQIARDLGREIAPEPKPKPANLDVPFFDDEFLDEPAAKVEVKGAKKTETEPIPFPRASSLRRPVLSAEELRKVTPSFGVLQSKSHLDVPGGQLMTTDDVEGDWTDVDAIDATLPITQPFENLVVHRETIDGTMSAAKQIVPTAKRNSLLSSGIQELKL